MTGKATRRTPEEELRDFARLQVRAGLLPPERQRTELAEAIAAELPGQAGNAAVLARAWLTAATAQLDAEQVGWPVTTDVDRLQAAFAECEVHDVPVLQGVDDHWAAKAELDRRAAEGRLPRGIIWFTPPDVWHAVDHGMLEINLWHGSTANAAPGDELLTAVLSCLERHGLRGRCDAGRIEVAAHW